eukprot:TRINITY_DN5697_c0_g2_i2.p1 TRINITY_DN5697_c0_g2~~TRINITY_DN5697_c0_g2_i2.p1  ORF type:complete len:675 (-),score=131.97 TRINITY_DN5697_c0_g2_i2:462-2486(-)
MERQPVHTPIAAKGYDLSGRGPETNGLDDLEQLLFRLHEAHEEVVRQQTAGLRQQLQDIQTECWQLWRHDSSLYSKTSNGVTTSGVHSPNAPKMQDNLYSDMLPPAELFNSWLGQQAKATPENGNGHGSPNDRAVKISAWLENGTAEAASLSVPRDSEVKQSPEAPINGHGSLRSATERHKRPTFAFCEPISTSEGEKALEEVAGGEATPKASEEIVKESSAVLETKAAEAEGPAEPQDEPMTAMGTEKSLVKRKMSNGTTDKGSIFVGGRKSDGVDGEDAPLAEVACPSVPKANESFIPDMIDRDTFDNLVYRVEDFYYETGVCQKVARSDWFANLTLAVIGLNAVYIGINADHNKNSGNTFDADWGFVFFDNFFCVYFFLEWIIRFGAFRRKQDCLYDGWFKFDSGLVTVMILETWVMPIVTLGGGKTAGTGPLTGIIKLLRLLRLTRMARLCRACPELMAMIKGVRCAGRAVGSALLMLIFLVYVFAVIMHTLVKGVDEDERLARIVPEDQHLVAKRFKSISIGMWTLLVDGTLLDGITVTSRALIETELYVAFVVLVIFVLMSAMTVMNMLIGVLCEVVTAVAAAEKEEAAIRLVKETVLVMLKSLDEDGSGEISRDEINSVFANAGALHVLESLKVDVTYLVDRLNMYYEVSDDLTITEIMDLILMMRG